MIAREPWWTCLSCILPPTDSADASLPANRSPPFSNTMGRLGIIRRRVIRVENSAVLPSHDGLATTSGRHMTTGLVRRALTCRDTGPLRQQVGKTAIHRLAPPLRHACPSPIPPAASYSIAPAYRSVSHLTA